MATKQIWDGSNISAEISGNNVTNKYTRGINLIKDDSSFFMYNAHGDVVHLLNTSGIITKSYKYDAFGNERNISESDTNPWRYCGEYYDSGIGTYYLRNRYYNPNNGRFTSEDPIHSGLNWYAYAASNPIRYIDPLGLYISEWDKAHLSKDELDLLEQYGNDWVNANAAGNRAEMDDAHAAAEAIRNRYRMSNEMGTGDGNTVHNPAGVYSSEADAAAAFGHKYNSQSFNRSNDYPDGREIGTIIYQGSSGFIYGPPVYGSHSSISERDFVISSDHGTPVALAHTHGGWTGSSGEYFTKEDILTAGRVGINSAFKRGLNAYVVTPGVFLSTKKCSKYK